MNLAVAPSPASKDDQHLQLLMIFHYVFAGLMGLSACLPVIHVAVGIAFIAFPEQLQIPPSERQEVKLIGVLFTVIGSIIILGGWFVAFLVFLAARNLGRRRSYTYCFIIACLLCVFMPLGTVLGVFTILVLTRPTVKERFLSAQ